jgi:hypothetical protein
MSHGGSPAKPIGPPSQSPVSRLVASVQNRQRRVRNLRIALRGSLFPQGSAGAMAPDASRKKPFLKRTKQVSWVRKVQGYAYQAS